MKDSVNISQLTKKYCLDTLSDEEGLTLERILEGNPELRKQFTEDVQSFQVLEAKATIDGKQLIQNLQGEYKIKQQRMLFGVIVALLILAGSSWLVVQPEETKETLIVKTEETKREVIPSTPVKEVSEIPASKELLEKIIVMPPKELEHNEAIVVTTVVEDSIQLISLPKAMEVVDTEIEYFDKTVIVINPCDDFETQFSFEVTPSVFEQENGALILLSGENELSLFFDGEDYGDTKEIEELVAGTHKVVVANEKGCEAKQSIVIPVTYCAKGYKKRFNIGVNKEWEIPLFEKAEARVIDKTGNTIRVINADENNTWDGYSSDSEMVDQGYYKIFVTFENKEVCIYNLTVFPE